MYIFWRKMITSQRFSELHLDMNIIKMYDKFMQFVAM